MTAPTTSRPDTAAADAPADRLRLLLLVDGVGTAALGSALLVAAGAVSAHVGTPVAVRLVGALFVVVGVGMLRARRLRGRRLARAGTVLGEVDLAWAVAGTAAVLAVGASGPGWALTIAVAAVCLVMGAAKLRLSRPLRG
jgi:hypothetical protein